MSSYSAYKLIAIWILFQHLLNFYGCNAALLATPLDAGNINGSVAGFDQEPTVFGAVPHFSNIFPHFDTAPDSNTAAAAASALDGESRLINKWLADPSVGRPRRNHSESVNVMIGLSLFSISEVDEDLEVAVLHGWMVMKWTDEHLKWNASAYGGVSIISVPDEMVWKPDITMHNAASHDKTVEIFGTSNVNVYSNGRVIWGPPTTLHVPMQHVNNSPTWPRDRYSLSVRIGSWSHSSTLVNIVATGTESLEGGAADLSDYTESSRWNLLNFTGRAQLEEFQCCPDISFAMMLFEGEIERKPNFLLHLVGWPLKVVLLSTCFLFALPVIAVAFRMLMAVAYFVVYAVLLLVLEEVLPHAALYGDRMPVPIVVMVCAMILLLIDMVWIAVIGATANVSHRRFPRVCMPLLYAIGYVLCLDPRQRGDEQKIALYRRVSEDAATLDGASGGHVSNNNGSPSSRSNWATPGDGTASEADVVRDNMSSWQYTAAVLNRIAFVTNCISVIVIMAVTP